MARPSVLSGFTRQPYNNWSFSFRLGQILDSYQTDDKIGQMLKNMDFYITPVLNIDGYKYTWLNDSVSRLYI